MKDLQSMLFDKYMVDSVNLKVKSHQSLPVPFRDSHAYVWRAELLK